MEEETSKFSNLFSLTARKQIFKISRCSYERHSKVWRFVSAQFFLYVTELVGGELFGELACRSIRKCDNSVNLLRYNNYICYVNNINAVLKTFRCSTCDTFLSKTGNLERNLVTCSERVKHIYPSDVHELRKTLFQKQDEINILFTDEQNTFKNLENLIFESICVRKDSYKETESTKWVGRHMPMSVSVSLNLIQEPLFPGNTNPHNLISSFITAVERLATQGNAQMQLKFFEVETAMKIKLFKILEQLNEKANRAEAGLDFADDRIIDCE